MKNRNKYIKPIIITLLTLLSSYIVVGNGLKDIHWRSLVVLPKETFTDFIVKVIVVYLFYTIEKDLNKEKYNRTLLNRFYGFKLQSAGIGQFGSDINHYLQNLSKFFTAKEIQELKDLNAIPKDYSPDKDYSTYESRRQLLA